MRVSMAVEEALSAGDVDAVRAALGDPPDWPNVVEPYLGASVLSLAYGHAPLAAIRQLLAEGADPNFQPENDGFPALVDVIHHRRDDDPRLAHAWDDRHALLAELIAAGADLEARGINDWTALHVAAVHDDDVAVRILLEAGADPQARARIDDLESPVDVAEQSAPRAAAVFREWIASS